MNPPGLALRTDTPGHAGGRLLCSLCGKVGGQKEETEAMKEGMEWRCLDLV